jgi:hypothetical protein
MVLRRSVGRVSVRGCRSVSWAAGSGASSGCAPGVGVALAASTPCRRPEVPLDDAFDQRDGRRLTVMSTVVTNRHPAGGQGRVARVVLGRGLWDNTGSGKTLRNRGDPELEDGASSFEFPAWPARWIRSAWASRRTNVFCSFEHGVLDVVENDVQPLG